MPRDYEPGVTHTTHVEKKGSNRLFAIAPRGGWCTEEVGRVGWRSGAGTDGHLWKVPVKLIDVCSSLPLLHMWQSTASTAPSEWLCSWRQLNAAVATWQARCDYEEKRNLCQLKATVLRLCTHLLHVSTLCCYKIAWAFKLHIGCLFVCNGNGHTKAYKLGATKNTMQKI